MGLVLLGLSFALGCTVLFLGEFVDESEKLSVALLMARGLVLYRDLFSHHFPFVYDWLAVLFWLMGPSVLVARWSVLVFQLLTFVLIMRLTRLYTPLGLVAVLWGAIGHLYGANMALYQTFAALALIAVFVLTLAVLTSWCQLGRGYWLVLGVFAGVAILSDPGMTVAVSVALALLTISRTGRHRVLWSLIMLGLILAAYSVRLALAGVLGDFYRDVIVFNAQVYSRYEGTIRNLLRIVLNSLQRGLDILDPTLWRSEADYGPIAQYGWLGRRLFDGLLYRLVFILLCLTLLVRRRWLAAMFAYVFAGAMLARAGTWIRLQPFTLAALAAAVLIVADGLFAQNLSAPSLAGWRKIVTITAYRISVGVRFALVVALLWMAVLGLGRIAVLGWHGHLTYKDNFGYFMGQAANIKSLACSQDAILGYYPGHPIVYFYTGLRPVSRYVLMWPWVAEVAMPDVLASLQSESAQALT
jgi:hypothetical protein